MPKQKRLQQGYILLEGLISFLIVSFGVLGLLAMQSFLQARHMESQLRVQASMFSNELISMAVADSTNAGCYVIPVSTQQSCGSAIAKGFAQSWENDVKAKFPGANSNVPTATLNANNNYTVTIFWQRNNDGVLHNQRVVTNIKG